ncbi:hypothetical protein BaRGS_00023215, partial [Batillaria attramentaria]
YTFLGNSRVGNCGNCCGGLRGVCLFDLRPVPLHRIPTEIVALQCRCRIDITTETFTCVWHLKSNQENPRRLAGRKKMDMVSSNLLSYWLVCDWTPYCLHHHRSMSKHWAL